jgi:hypothetical protein
MSSSVQKKIQELWRLRFLQKNLLVHNELRFLFEAGSFSSSEEIEMQVLRSSLLRAEGKVEQAEQMLNTLSESGAALPFQYYVQRALNLFFIAEFSLALEFFNRAKELAQKPLDKLIISFNTLLCLENLNFKTERQLEEVKSNLHQLEDEEISKILAQQLIAFEQRQSFRNGRLANVFAHQLTNVDQAFYYRYWVAHLPYVNADGWIRKHDLSVLSNSSDLRHKAFRLKTISGDVRMNDGAKIEPQEMIDRIYLWTWYWVVQPNKANADRLRSCLMAFDFNCISSRLTGEDIWLLRNALKWIVVLQPSSRRFINSALQLLEQQKIEPSMLFEFEEKFIESLSQNKQISGQFYNDENFRWKELLKKIKLLQKPSGKFDGLVIDQDTFQVKTKDAIFISESIVKVLDLLASEEQCTFSDALEFGFQISGYDDGIHKVKIHNLLNRIKKILPRQLKIVTRGQFIYLQGEREKISRVRNQSYRIPVVEKALMQKQRIAQQKNILMDRWVHPRLVLKKAAGKSEISRHDLQRVMRASKATTNRWIQKWLDHGYIRRTGTGKSTTYLIELT